jgi:hypothetical protein
MTASAWARSSTRPPGCADWRPARSRLAGAPTSTSAARRAPTATAAATPSTTPAIVIGSGSGPNCHAYWPLSEPLGRDEAERGNRRLAHALGADPASADAARILRVPGTWSHKRQPPTAVDALVFDTRRRVAAADVVGGLADPPEPCPTAPSPAVVGDRDDPLQSIVPEVYVRRLLGVQVPRHRKVSCPFHEDRHPSLHVYDTPERGWYCFGRCRRGGTIYDLAGLLYGYATTGEQFVQLRSELRCLFGLDAVR